MRGYPKYIPTKQDYLNLLADEGHRARALADLEGLYANDDTLIMTTTELMDPKDPMSDWKQVLKPNPSPLWKQKGFVSRTEVAEIITANGGTI